MFWCTFHFPEYPVEKELSLLVSMFGDQCERSLSSLSLWQLEAHANWAIAKRHHPLQEGLEDLQDTDQEAQNAVSLCTCLDIASCATLSFVFVLRVLIFSVSWFYSVIFVFDFCNILQLSCAPFWTSRRRSSDWLVFGEFGALATWIDLFHFIVFVACSLLKWFLETF